MNRVTTAAELARFALRHVLPTFLSSNPKVRTIETATDRMVDIVGEGSIWRSGGMALNLAIRGYGLGFFFC
ncbi:hypothetical protein [Cupriavidus basilensis]|uniref:hypothetical protein n=1 Tax=Cupriavidus basilensis TaxID=68895 RepID=UPI0023E7C930|nr:hypothetical protein [Cupriavidus basilensis]MDF3885450.1 hypothetical protein [Cupriavidus basilensis]